MKLYLMALGAGLLVGVIYSVLNIRSPAPPVVALIGLLGILAGEQIVPVAKRIMAGEKLSLGWLRSECGEHVFGALPARSAVKDCTSGSGGTPS
ncbi:XapX domain-containing protein [Bosea sp. Leaf344]|uniref:XapX domain-containing protein n=1 Tax=Bosea sp. Leaf344 TaxID=1736346 RepID=UPI0006FC12A6|nr:XapX domain-containing protein [Bosea sp. Leaf344]KQU50591.1 XapX domain-containing protein [Bosea sp. Leaf344]